MLNTQKKLSNGQTWQEYVCAIRSNYDQPAVTYPAFQGKQWLDVPYAPDSLRQRFNVYVPEGDGPFPAIVWVHGGGWYTGDRSDRWLASVLPLTGHGFALVSVGYRLADEAVFPGPVEDVVCAVEQIARTGARYGIDTANIGVMGGSAGANLAAHAAVRCACIKAALLQCPPLDFSAYRAQFAQAGLTREGSTMPEEDTSYEAMYLGGSILELPKLAAEANPANCFGQNLPPFLLVHGTADAVVPFLQSVSFQQAVNRAAHDEARAKLIPLEGGDHDSPALDTDGLFDQKLAFFRRHLT
jgi:acetyl esterase/lipase